MSSHPVVDLDLVARELEALLREDHSRCPAWRMAVAGTLGQLADDPVVKRAAPPQ